MISESTKAVEKEGFQFPAVVSLLPKRRCRAWSQSISGDKEAGELTLLTLSPLRRRRKLKRTGRLVLRWVDPKLCPAAPQAAPCTP
jgi:hypothetical protein